VSLQEPGVSIEYQGIEESGHFKLEPCPTEYDITLQYLILKGCSECSFWHSLFHYLLYLSSNSRDCTNLSSLELRYFELAIEHSLDECSILMDLQWLSHQLKLLHNLKLTGHFQDHSGHTDSEMGHILALIIQQLLYSNECCAHCVGWPINNSVAKPKLRSIFNHSESLGLIFCHVDRQ
jgi:hypothetical protein